jgi:hypothetical protein
MRYKDGQFYTTEKLSERMEKTPEGFLLCHDVPISRTGFFEYLKSETNLKTADDRGIVKMERPADELFSEQTIKSFEGKPVVIGHSSFVTPENWKDRTIGIVQNVRRGLDKDSDKLLADLLITDRKGINIIEKNNLREVSCGYDAIDEEISEGIGRMSNIIGNHVALVENGRCGSACRIKDSAMSTNLKSVLRRLFKDGDDEKFNETLDELEIKKVSEESESEAIEKPEDKPEEAPAVKTDAERLNDLETAFAELKEKVECALNPKKDEDAEKADECEPEKADECKADEDEVEEAVECVSDAEATECVKDAEAIAPEMKMPKGDSQGKYTKALIEQIKRSALKQGGVTQFGDIDSLNSQAVDVAFKSAVIMQRSGNNPKPKRADGAISSRPTNAELNARFADFWKRK